MFARTAVLSSGFHCTILVTMSSNKLLNIFELARVKGRSVRELRTLQHKGLIPYLKLGHRTCLYDLAKVDSALARYEIKAIGK